MKEENWHLTPRFRRSRLSIRSSWNPMLFPGEVLDDGAIMLEEKKTPQQIKQAYNNCTRNARCNSSPGLGRGERHLCGGLNSLRGPHNTFLRWESKKQDKTKQSKWGSQARLRDRREWFWLRMVEILIAPWSSRWFSGHSEVCEKQKEKKVSEKLTGQIKDLERTGPHQRLCQFLGPFRS